MRLSRGSILVVAILVLTFFISWISIGLRRSTSEHLASETNRNNLRAFHLAEAGLEQTIRNLRTIDAADDVFAAAMPVGTFTVQQPLTLLQPLLYQVHVQGASANAHHSVDAVLDVTPLSLFRFAMFGNDGITISGSTFIDSYDSRNGPYNVVTNAGDQGNVGTNAVGANAITLTGNSLFINGQLSVGPGVSPATGAVTGFDPSRIAGDPPVVSSPEYPMPTVKLPAGITCSPLSLNGQVTYTLPSPGTYCFSDLRVQGGATLTSTGPVTVYLTRSLAFEGNSTIGVANDPTKFLFLMESGTQVTIEGSIEGNAEFYGSMYGPDAAFNVEGHADIYGSIIGNRVTMAGSAELHYDKALADQKTLSNEGIVTVRSWRETD